MPQFLPFMRARSATFHYSVRINGHNPELYYWKVFGCATVQTAGKLQKPSKYRQAHFQGIFETIARLFTGLGYSISRRAMLASWACQHRSDGEMMLRTTLAGRVEPFVRKQPSIRRQSARFYFFLRSATSAPAAPDATYKWLTKN